MNPERLRICRFVQDILPPEKAYGYFISFYYISKEQQKQGQKLLILKPAKYYSKEILENFDIVSIPLRKRGLFYSDKRNFIKTIGAIVRSWDADIIHTHISVGNYLHGTPNLPPTVHHIHGLPYHALNTRRTFREISQKKCQFWNLIHDLHADSLYKKYLRRANAVIVFSQDVRVEVIKRYRVPPENVHVVFNGVSSAFLDSYSKLEMRKELSLDEDCFYVLFVGRLVEGKGVITLLKAIRQIMKIPQGKNIRLLIVGSKYGTNRLQSLVRAFVSQGDVVIEVPHVPYENLPKYYAAADLHVLGHTFGYGIPKTCFESLACGTPVIMTRNLDAEVIVGHNEHGMLLNNATDHMELTKRIIYFAEHEGLSRKMGERGRKLIREKYTWERTVEQINDIYRMVLDDS